MQKVSVIIPTYNRGSSLPKAIDSVIGQTYGHWELLIVDDGSVDDTATIVREYAAKDDRIKYFYQQNSGGPASPRNVGIQHSSGGFVAFLDSDDAFLPEKLENQLALFNATNYKNLGFVGCNVSVIEVTGDEDILVRRSEFKIKYHGNVQKELFRGNFILSCTNILIKRDVFEVVGEFDTRLRYLDDWDMWLRCAHAGYEFDFVHKPLFDYYLHGSNITKNFNQLQILSESEAILNKYVYFVTDAELLYEFGLRSFFVGDYERTKKYIKKSIAINSKNFKARYILLCLTFGFFGKALLKGSFMLNALFSYKK